MGTDALDLTFRCEKEFGVTLDRDELFQLLRNGNTADPPVGRWTDLRVREFMEWIEDSLRRQSVTYNGDVFPALCRLISECLIVPESEVTLEAWLCRDLGAE